MKRPALVPCLALTLTLALLPIGAGADPLAGSPTTGTPVGMAAPTSASLLVTKPLGDGTVTLTFTANGVTQTVTVSISGTDSAASKRNKIQTALQNKGYSVSINITDGTVEISDLPAGTTVTFDPGTTGESKDQLTVSQATMTMVDFGDSFAALGGDGRPATFTAGVATEQGEVVATYKAATRSGGTITGEEIAARLYNELVAAASDLGVTLALEGSRIVVERTPATAVEGTSLGLTFGTTSISHGLKAASGPPAPRLKPFIQ